MKLSTLILSLVFAVAPAMVSAAGFVSDGGVGTPSATPVLEHGGYGTPSDTGTVGGGFLAPTAADAGLTFDERIARVRRGLLAATDDATCAPARLELRLQRRLRRTVAQLVAVSAGPADEIAAHLTRAAELLRGYCATVDGAADLRPDCATLLRRPCPAVASDR